MVLILSVSLSWLWIYILLVVLLNVMYDEMSNKQRNTEGVVSIMTHPFVMFNVSASFCTARAFVMVRAQCACADRPCSSDIYTTRERERKMLWSCSKTAWLKRCSLSPATVAVLSLLAVGASTQTGMHSILLSSHVDRDMCFLDRAT